MSFRRDPFYACIRRDNAPEEGENSPEQGAFVFVFETTAEQVSPCRLQAQGGVSAGTVGMIV